MVGIRYNQPSQSRLQLFDSIIFNVAHLFVSVIFQEITELQGAVSQQRERQGPV